MSGMPEEPIAREANRVIREPTEEFGAFWATLQDQATSAASAADDRGGYVRRLRCPVPRSTIHSARWPVTSAMMSKSLSQ